MKNWMAGLCGIMGVLGMGTGAMALNVTPMDSAENLAAALLGEGITISNVTYSGASVASGYFTDGLASGIGMDEGIVLTSGNAMNVDGLENTDTQITGDHGMAGDPMLSALVAGADTYDATILEFDFEFTAGYGGDLYFKYVFGSDEYLEYVAQGYNDVFGFFLDGTDASDNIALLPGTTTPVAIDNINDTTNSEYYNDNFWDHSSEPYAFEYDGFTSVLTVEVLNLDPGIHHIALAIADVGDFILDSGVFIEAKTFSNTPPDPEPVPEPSTLLLLGTSLLGLLALGRKKGLKK